MGTQNALQIGRIDFFDEVDHVLPVAHERMVILQGHGDAELLSKASGLGQAIANHVPGCSRVVQLSKERQPLLANSYEPTPPKTVTAARPSRE